MMMIELSQGLWLDSVALRAIVLHRWAVSELIVSRGDMMSRWASLIIDLSNGLKLCTYLQQAIVDVLLK